MESDHVTMYGGDTRHPQMGAGRKKKKVVVVGVGGGWETCEWRRVRSEFLPVFLKS